MTMRELIDFSARHKGSLDKRITIRFNGGQGGSTVEVDKAIVGFDWTRDQIVIVPHMDLVPKEWLEKRG